MLKNTRTVPSGPAKKTYGISVKKIQRPLTPGCGYAYNPVIEMEVHYVKAGYSYKL